MSTKIERMTKSMQETLQSTIVVEPIVQPPKKTRPLMTPGNLLPKQVLPRRISQTKMPLEKQFQEMVWLTTQASTKGIRETYSENHKSMETLDASMISAILNATRIPTPNYVVRTSYVGSNQSPTVRKSRQLHVNTVPFSGINKQEPIGLKSILLDCYVDMLSYKTNKNDSEYHIEGPLKLIFDHFKTREDPKSQYSSLSELSFDDIQRANSTLSQNELLYFASYFGIISPEYLSNAEVIAIITPVKDKIQTSHEKAAYIHDLYLSDFVEIMARIAYYIYPKLPKTTTIFKQIHCDNCGIKFIDVEDLKNDSNNTLKDENNISLSDKIDIFMKHFKLDNLDYVKKMLLKATTLTDVHFTELRSVNKGPIKDVMRMGLAVKVGKNIGRDIHWNQIKRNNFVNEEGLRSMRKYVTYKPKFDFRKFDATYINFGSILINQSLMSEDYVNEYKHPRLYRAQLKITNNAPKSGYKFNVTLNPSTAMNTTLSSLVPEQEMKIQLFAQQFVNISMPQQKEALKYGITFKVEIEINPQFIHKHGLLDEYLFFVYVFGADVYHQESTKLLCKVPVYVRFEQFTDQNCVQQLPSIRLFKE